MIRDISEHVMIDHEMHPERPLESRGQGMLLMEETGELAR